MFYTINDYIAREKRVGIFHVLEVTTETEMVPRRKAPILCLFCYFKRSPQSWARCLLGIPTFIISDVFDFVAHE